MKLAMSASSERNVGAQSRTLPAPLKKLPQESILSSIAAYRTLFTKESHASLYSMYFCVQIALATCSTARVPFKSRPGGLTHAWHTMGKRSRISKEFCTS